MFGFFKKKINKKQLYKVDYISCCTVYADKIEFKKEFIESAFVHADNVLKAQAEFALHHMVYPNVCIVSVKRVDPPTILN